MVDFGSRQGLSDFETGGIVGYVEDLKRAKTPLGANPSSPGGYAGQEDAVCGWILKCPSTMVKIIGIDPGLAATGIGLVQGKGTRLSGYSYGCIQTSSRDKIATRLDCIYTKLSKLLADEKPDLMVVEAAFSLNKYPKSGIDLGKVTGVILLAGHRAGIPVTEVAVREAKKILTGNGNAGKEQLEKAVRRTICAFDPIRPYHASDAIGLAIIGLYRYDRLHRG